MTLKQFAEPTNIDESTISDWKRRGNSYNCDGCGEKTGANWIRLVGGKKLCLDCCEQYDRFRV